MGDET